MNHEWTILEYDKARDRIKRDTVCIKVKLNYFQIRMMTPFVILYKNTNLFLFRAVFHEFYKMRSSKVQNISSQIVTKYHYSLHLHLLY